MLDHDHFRSFGRLRRLALLEWTWHLPEYWIPSVPVLYFLLPVVAVLSTLYTTANCPCLSVHRFYRWMILGLVPTYLYSNTCRDSSKYSLQSQISCPLVREWVPEGSEAPWAFTLEEFQFILKDWETSSIGVSVYKLFYYWNDSNYFDLSHISRLNDTFLIVVCDCSSFTVVFTAITLLSCPLGQVALEKEILISMTLIPVKKRIDKTK